MSKYYASYELDKFVKETFFPKKLNGYFIDIGSHNGVDMNNTYYFENEGWDGICFEPIPKIFQELKLNRKCKLVNKAISDKNGISKFFAIEGYSDMLSGLVDNYNDTHIIRINDEIEKYNQSFDYIDVECATFDKEVNRTDIDILSIDTEGSELAILKSIDFKKYNINTMIIEYNYHNQDLINLINDNGFQIVNKIGVDIIAKNINYVY